MRVGTFQFKASDSIGDNKNAIIRGIEKAAKENVRFLITQECGLCGYPPIETESVDKIDFVSIEKALIEIKQSAQKNNVYIGVGSIIQSSSGKFYNSIELITPNEIKLSPYHKRALWGWDRDSYLPGIEPGIYCVDGLKFGIRICFEVRFPEYFRQLFKDSVKIAFVSFCDVSDKPNEARYKLIQSHLVTRAVENSIYVITANSISKNQTAPTCIINPDGTILQQAQTNTEQLLYFEFENEESNFGRNGRRIHSKELLGMNLDTNE